MDAKSHLTSITHEFFVARDQDLGGSGKRRLADGRVAAILAAPWRGRPALESRAGCPRHTESSIAIGIACFVVIASILALGVPAFASESPQQVRKELGVTVSVFGKMPAGRDVMIFELTNANGLRARVMEYGAILVSLEVPDRDGKLGDIALGFDDFESYLKRNPMFGSTVGRYANRIADASFKLDGVEYRITKNSGKNHIHGGNDKRFDRVLWTGYPYKTDAEAGVRFTHLSLDGEEGFPGNLDCIVTYALTNRNELRITYSATTDKPTIVNFTNHSYFNLAGAGNGDVLDHEVTISAPWYTPAGEGLIPTGEIRSVAGTPLDFTQPHKIGERIAELTDTRGYDHNYVLKASYGEPALAARVYEPTSGRVMEVTTTQPGVQLYTANGMKSVKGKAGKVYNDHAAFCLETQHFPDSPNKPHFPSTVLRPGQTYLTTSTFAFTTK
jgi:aldose 1-epimerase